MIHFFTENSTIAYINLSFVLVRVFFIRGLNASACFGDSGGFVGHRDETTGLWQVGRKQSQPPKVVCKMEAQLDTHFCKFGTDLYRLLTKSLHQSSVGSLLRVCCWLGWRHEVCGTSSSSQFCQIDGVASMASPNCLYNYNMAVNVSNHLEWIRNVTGLK